MFYGFYQGNEPVEFVGRGGVREGCGELLGWEFLGMGEVHDMDDYTASANVTINVCNELKLMNLLKQLIAYSVEIALRTFRMSKLC